MKVFSEKDLIDFLQKELCDVKKMIDKHSLEDPYTNMRFEWMIGQKEMVEVLIGKPVNLGVDGVVTVGF